MIKNSSICEEDSWRRHDEGWFVRDRFAANRRVNMLQKLLWNGILTLTRKGSPLPQRRRALGRGPGGDLLLSGGVQAPPDSPRSGHWVSGKER